MKRVGRGWIPKNIANHIEHEKNKIGHTGTCVEIKASELSAEKLAEIMGGQPKGRTLPRNLIE